MTDNDREFTWFNLAKSLIGGAVGGVIEGLGIGGSALIRTPRVALEVFRSLWRTKTFGPVLKTTLVPAALVGAVAAPEVAVLGGLIYGMVEGFGEGTKEGFPIITTAVKTIKKFHAESVDNAVEDLIKWSNQEPTTVYEIRVIEAVKGLLSGIVGFAVTGAGVSFFTIINVPTIWGKTTRAIWESGGPLPFLVGAQVLATVLIGLAVPLTVVVATLGGLGLSTYHGYTKGFLTASRRAFSDVGRYNRALCKALYK